MPAIAKNYKTELKTPVQMLNEDLSSEWVVNPDYDAIREKIIETQADLHNVVLARKQTPADFSELFYMSEPIRKLSQLGSDWDGKGSAALSAEILNKAEELWEAIVDMVPVVLLPDLLPGASDFVTFSWRRVPRKNLQLTIFMEDDAFVYDWLLETEQTGRLSGELKNGIDLSTLVSKYLAA